MLVAIGLPLHLVFFDPSNFLDVWVLTSTPTPTPGPHGLLVVEDDVRPPDEFRGDADGGDILVVTRVPAQLVVVPLLGGSGETCVRWM